MRKNFWIIPVVIGAGLLIWWANTPNSANSGQRGRPATGVRIVEVKKQAITISGEALGSTRAAESILITSTVAETIEEIHFEEGQSVKKGDLLVTFRLAEVQAQRDVIAAEIAENRREVDRLQRLVKQGAAPRSQLDSRLTLLRKAEAQLRQAEARIKERMIRAPFDGFVGIRNYSVGALVRPGDVITTLDDIANMKLEMSVPASFLPRLQVGLPLVARSPVFGNDRIFEGRITQIDSRIDPTTRSLRVHAEIPNDELLLKPGIFMNVDIVQQEREGLLIPEIALISRRDQNFVYRVDEENRVEEVAITIGVRIPGQVEVVEGLKEGDQIITEGTVKVNPGHAVEVLNPPATGT
ncbi:MAG: efflux RND transporter periplasmic adaptor subunit [Oligoflexus sp.]